MASVDQPGWNIQYEHWPDFVRRLEEEGIDYKFWFSSREGFIAVQLTGKIPDWIQQDGG